MLLLAVLRRPASKASLRLADAAAPLIISSEPRRLPPRARRALDNLVQLSWAGDKPTSVFTIETTTDNKRRPRLWLNKGRQKAWRKRGGWNWITLYRQTLPLFCLAPSFMLLRERKTTGAQSCWADPLPLSRVERMWRIDLFPCGFQTPTQRLCLWMSNACWMVTLPARRQHRATCARKIWIRFHDSKNLPRFLNNNIIFWLFAHSFFPFFF